MVKIYRTPNQKSWLRQWKVVPQSRTGGQETPISEFVVCSRHEQLPHVIGIGPQWATTNVRHKATVVCEVRGSRSNERLTYELRDLEHNALTDWQPVQLPEAYVCEQLA